MSGYTLDTSVVCALFSKEKVRREHVADRIRGLTIQGVPITLNSMSYYETRLGLVIAGLKKELLNFETFCKEFSVLPCTVPVLDRACNIWVYLRKAYGDPVGKDKDLIIAATALEHEMIVVTANVRDFERIPNLTIENWLETA